jgi:hypothetical protein
VKGFREVVLCAGCDRGEGGADELLALFAVDECVTAGNAGTFACLVRRWVAVVAQGAVQPAELEEEAERWWCGEL